MLSQLDRAVEALHAIPPDVAREEWVKAGMAAQAAGIDFDTFNDWSAGAGNYSETAARDTWRSFKEGKGVGAGTLFRMAAEHGWRLQTARADRSPRPMKRQPPAVSAAYSAATIWERCEPASLEHPYIIKKKAAGVPLEGLRVVPAGDPLTLQGESMAGALVVPVWRETGELSTLQVIAPPAVAERLKAKNKPDKLNLPSHSVEGFFTVGEIAEGQPVYIVEGIGTAWACWQATGAPSVVCFGAGNMAKVAAKLRKQHPEQKLVLVPDVGKENQAAAIAAEVSGFVALMPSGWERNSDVHDLAQAEGMDVLEALLSNATEPPKPAPRYKLLGGDELRSLPPLAWRVAGVLPAVGLAALYGPSASGKSFLSFDMAAAIASGQRWFGCRVAAAPVVYAALEGEAGFKLRAQAWETYRGHALPSGLKMMLQPFQLTSPEDVRDLAAVVPKGAVVFVDTLNRAAPTADENSSRDMGEILEAAKRLQSLTGGLVILIHHTGKDATKGLRGHSSLFAAMDAAVEVSRDGDRREWKIAKAKDGADGEAHSFRLEIETLGTDDYGDPVTSCTIRMDTSKEDVKRVKVPQGGNQKLVYEGIRDLFKDGKLGKPGAPPLRPCIELEAAVTAGAMRMTCDAHRRTTRAREAITGLVAKGVLGLHEGWLWSAN
ncbi:AAA family ATPase [Rhodoferax mekongensis]|uniref:AAA family ATPase n=1 Tax=Rhodoferax mekongensis TaxID=3068341 RepID=UPI0028BDE045|nr:AAA family ATPase [Rhodoferax sp. TBRC 17199]MDT7514552.1 AAA family ATPase [Rhodoferax sp. TBRC 17199]